MTKKQFFSLGSIAKLAKLVHRSQSTIYRWKREGIPKSVRPIVEKLVKKKTKPKPRKLEPTFVPLTKREAKQQLAQKKLALEEKRRLALIEKEWVVERIPQKYTDNMVGALIRGIKTNKERLKKKPRKANLIRLAIRIARQMVQDYIDGNEYTDPDLIQPLLDEFAIDESEAYHDIYGYVK